MLDISKATSNSAYMIIPKIPNMEFWIKTISMPNVTNGQTNIPMPQHFQWKVPSVHATVDDINIMYYADENMTKYFALLQWMSECRKAVDVRDVMCDTSIIILNNQKQKIIRLSMIDSWITNVGPLDFDTTNSASVTPFFMMSCTSLKWEYLDGSGIHGEF